MGVAQSILSDAQRHLVATKRYPELGDAAVVRALRWPSTLECPRFTSTDVDGLTCKTPLVAGARGVAAQRITSVAWKRRVGGIVRPRASAVFRLMTNSNFMGCSTGRSAGLVPFRILST